MSTHRCPEWCWSWVKESGSLIQPIHCITGVADVKLTSWKKKTSGRASIWQRRFNVFRTLCRVVLTDPQQTGTHQTWYIHPPNLGEYILFAVTSSPMPWITVFVSPEKINVFQDSGDWEWSRPQGPKIVHNFVMTTWKLSWACDFVAKKLLILTKIFSTRLFEGKSSIWPSKELSHDFARGQSLAETCFSYWS